MYVDRRFGPARYFSARPKDWLMRIPDHMLRSVAFLGDEDSPDQPTYLGTGFFVQIMYADPDHFTVGLRFLVTARHVAAGKPGSPGTGIKDLRAPFAEYTNLFSEAFKVSLTGVRWHYHDDESVDLAICHLPLDSRGTLALSEETFLKDDFSELGIGIGDETFSISLFGFEGESRSPVPIVRVGNIAMLPPHKVRSEYGEVHGHLIEARSLSGFSGAPVFVRETVRFLDVTKPASEPKLFATGSMRLLGVMHGHWELGGLNKGVNTGVAIVVPSAKLAELFDSAPVRAEMASRAAEERARRSGAPAMLDSGKPVGG
jgi:hypothetical protein